MRRAALALGGVVALGTAALLAPTPVGGASLAGALGRSTGGMRTVLVDVLFLRADALRRRGRIEEVPSLYATILELDPDNVAAFDHLAAVYAFDVLPEGISAADRLAWWREGWDAVERGLALHPGAATLLVRSADLLRLAADAPDLAGPVGRIAGGDPEVLAVERLAEAARQAGDLPGKGRVHLVTLALLAPASAAERMADGRPGAPRLREAAREVLRLRGPTLRDMRLPPPDATPEAEGPTFEAFLAAALDVLDRLASLPPAGAEARAAFAAYADAWPDSPVVEPLRALVSR